MKVAEPTILQRGITAAAITAVALVSLWSLPVMARPQVGVGGPSEDKTAPDNTRMNRPDRKGGAPTAEQQQENSSDRGVSRRIRQEIQKDKSLSTYGHNVKVITENGVVTLKGPVRSEEEKSEIESIAGKIAGDSNVKSQIMVAPKKGKSNGR